MNVEDKKNEYAIDLIEEFFDKHRDWKKIETLNVFGLGEHFDTNFKILKNSEKMEETYSQNEWFKLVSSVRIRKEKNADKDEIIAQSSVNNASISTNPKSAWMLYKRNLKEKGWDRNTIDSIQSSSLNILKYLSKDTGKLGPIKGLVLGNVQSGKTANMAGLISMAADYGFNCFIVLSGMIENLRKQTQDRLVNDVVNNGQLDWQIIEHPHPVRPLLKTDAMDNLDLSSDSKKRYLNVSLKNSSRLNNLLKWLYSSKAQAKNLKVLIIDDEADQASINTKKMDINSEEDKERSRINELIINMVNGYNGKNLGAVNYISYTATPYANVLNEAGTESLYPKDFIVSLPVSDDYIGPRKLFGLTEPDETEDLPLIRNISQDDVDTIKDINEGETGYIPKSLKDAIQWYLSSSMAMMINGHKSPISMLVHVNQKINSHSYMEEVILDYLHSVKTRNLEKFLYETKMVYLTETSEFSKEDFIEGMPGYSRDSNEIPEYPSWPEIEDKLRILFFREEEEFVSKIPMEQDGSLKFHKGIHLCIDNSAAKYSPNEHVRIVYPEGKNKPKHATLFIVIGGNTLSRGLTLEGLTTSYFMRNTFMSDTLMQMGRWFGYRKGYEIYPRIWMNETARDRFKFVAQLDQELRETIEEYAEKNATPSDYGVMVKNSTNNKLIQVTSKNKQQGAEYTDLDFQGINKQTILFEDKPELLNDNIDITNGFFNKLGKPIKNGSRLVWENVDFEVLKTSFLSKYSAPKQDIMFSNLKALVKWCDSLEGDARYDRWNVVLSSKGEIRKNPENSDWVVHGYGVANVDRSVLIDKKGNPRLVNIGSLRAPRDLLSDITEGKDSKHTRTLSMKEVRQIRRDNNIDHIPQLVIYRINKDSKPKIVGEKNKRTNLEFSQDIIAISIMIPGKSVGQNLAKNLMINIDNSDEDYVEE